MSRLGSRFLSDYGMVLVLLALCAYYSIATFGDQSPTGAAGGASLAPEVIATIPPGGRVLIVVRNSPEDGDFAHSLADALTENGIQAITVQGTPSDTRAALEQAANSGRLGAIAVSQGAAEWPVLHDPGRRFPALAGVPVLAPRHYRWPTFLTSSNLLNVANQIAVIAILAVGATLVIFTGGIDLSAGSLIALAAVVATLLIRDLAGATNATPAGMILCCLAAIVVCGVVGLFSGVLVTGFDIPPFIATLGVMLIASGLAFSLAESQSIYQVPDSFVWLGRGRTLGSIPNSVVLMATLYLVAHILTTRTTLGRYIYAVGGNAEAARLAGVPVRRVVLGVYVLSGALAGVGGIVMASELRSGAPTYGLQYELYVIAAAVVGGASLSGGEGKILGTLIGAFIIAVLQNGMNLTGVTSHSQKMVFGAVIIGAVLLDRLKRRGSLWKDVSRRVREGWKRKWDMPP